MTDTPVTDDTLGADLLPEYATLFELIAAEVRDLNDEQLDFRSDQWGWADWSIRVQLSHMASLIPRWLVLRWGDVLFPDGDHGVNDVQAIANSDFDRRMDDNKYHDLPVILNKLEEYINLARRVLAERSVGFLRAHSVIQEQNAQWALMNKAHPTGITLTDDPTKAVMLLEASMRHIYFEETTHLFNIQRLKRAQGLSAVSEIPRVGYWTLDGWDISEA
jgi:hypothetical protein